MPCSGDSKETCGGGGQISLYQKCGSTCQNVVYTINNSTSGSGAAGPSGNSSSSVAPMVSTAAPSSLASSEAGASPKYTYAPVTDGYNNVVVVTQTRTVIPLASMPTPESSCCTMECGGPKIITVTVALTTVTITANMPDTYSAVGAATTSASDCDGFLTTLSAGPVLITPSASAPYVYNNGTTTSHHHHSGIGHHSGKGHYYGTGHHSNIHSHATSKGRY
jgi:hypothetical protein